MVEWNKVTLRTDQDLTNALKEKQEQLGLNYNETLRFLLAEAVGVKFISSQTPTRRGNGKGQKYDHIKIRDNLYRFMQASEAYTYSQLSAATGYKRSMLRRINGAYPTYFKVIKKESQPIRIQKMTRRDREKLLEGE